MEHRFQQKTERKIDKVVLKYFPCFSDREKLVSITSNHQLCNKKNQRSAGSLISEINSLTFSIFSDFLLLNFSTTGFLIKTVECHSTVLIRNHSTVFAPKGPIVYQPRQTVHGSNNRCSCVRPSVCLSDVTLRSTSNDI